MRPWLPHFGALLLCVAAAPAQAESYATPWPAPQNTAATADLTRLVEPLHDDLGPGYRVRACENFIVVYNTDDRFAADRCGVLETTHRRFYDAFGVAGFAPLPLRERLVCVMFEEPDQFERYALSADRINMSWSRGYYSARTNRVAFFDERGDMPTPRGRAARADDDRPSPLLAATPNNDEADSASLNLAKTTHEAAHQIAFNCGLQTRGVMYPLWVSEGLATNFELASPEGRFGPEYDNPSRRRHMISALERGELVSLTEMAGLSRVPTHDPRRVTVTYAQSWAMFKFLFQRRPEQLRRYLGSLAVLPPGARSSEAMRREFVAAFGSVGDLEMEWADFLDGLRAGE